MRLTILFTDSAGTVLEREFSRLPICIGRRADADASLPDCSWMAQDQALIYRRGSQTFLMNLEPSQPLTLQGHVVETLQLTEVVHVELGPLSLTITLDQPDKPHALSPSIATRSPVARSKTRRSLDTELVIALPAPIPSRDQQEPTAGESATDWDTSPMVNFTDELTPVVTSDDAWEKTAPNLQVTTHLTEVRHFAFFTPLPEASRWAPSQRMLEVAVLRTGAIAERRVYADDRTIMADPSGRMGLLVKSLDKAQWIARLHDGKTEVYLPADLPCHWIDCHGRVQTASAAAEMESKPQAVGLPTDRALVIEFSPTEAVGMRLVRQLATETAPGPRAPSARWRPIVHTTLMSFLAGLLGLGLWWLYPSPDGADLASVDTRQPASANASRLAFSLSARPKDLPIAARQEWENELLPAALSRCFLESAEFSGQERYEITVTLRRSKKKGLRPSFSSPTLFASTHSGCAQKELKNLPWNRFETADVTLLRLTVEGDFTP